MATAVRRSFALRDVDPLSKLMQPPPGETVEERRARQEYEAESKRISEDIDRQIQVESAARKKSKIIRVLLLGQGESGKSTTLKNFQLKYAPEAWAKERASWRAVIQLNLTRSINVVAKYLTQEQQPETTVVLEEDDEQDTALPNGNGSHTSIQTPPPAVSDELLSLIDRLKVLRDVQETLQRRLGAGSSEDYTRAQEFFVRSAAEWKTALSKMTSSSNSPQEAAADDTAVVISDHLEDMKAFWTNPLVKEIVRSRKVYLQDSAEFFLESMDRVSQSDYVPTTDDVIRARLRTIGVQENRIVFENGPDAGSEWIMYDVGGSRSSRAAWPAYFDDVNAIIFVAPINVFNEKLLEDPRVNRLEDSYHLWTVVCSNKLLTKTQLILFLNKCDLLEKKLLDGVKFARYVPTFGDRTNDVATVSRYLKNRFTDIYEKHSPSNRVFHAHLTSVVDTKATAVTLTSVQEGIIRSHLSSLNLI